MAQAPCQADLFVARCSSCVRGMFADDEALLIRVCISASREQHEDRVDPR